MMVFKKFCLSKIKNYPNFWVKVLQNSTAVFSASKMKKYLIKHVFSITKTVLIYIVYWRTNKMHSQFLVLGLNERKKPFGWVAHHLDTL